MAFSTLQPLSRSLSADFSSNAVAPRSSIRSSLPAFSGADSFSFSKSQFVSLHFSQSPPNSGSKMTRPLRKTSLQVNAAGTICYPTSMTWWKKGNDLSNVREINSAQEFNESLATAQNKLVLVEFFSVGCRSCKSMHPKVCQIAADNPDIEVLKVNFYDNHALCKSLNVNILPFFHFYRGQEGLVDAFSCSLTKINKLREAVSKYKNCDQQLSIAHAPGPVEPVRDWNDLLNVSNPAVATYNPAVVTYSSSS